MNYRGDWLYCADYQPGEVVKSGGDLFMALQQSAGKDPQDPLNAGYWKKLSGGEAVPDHNDLDGLQGGTELERFHLTQDTAEGAEGSGASAADPMAKTSDIIRDHNLMDNVQGGRLDKPGEKYHLSKDAAEAAEWARRPGKQNPFLTRDELPQFSRDVSPFHLAASLPPNMGMLYGAAYSDAGNGLFVAVGDNYAVHASKANPELWESDTGVPVGYWRGAAAGGLGIIVAVGLQGKVMWRDASSPDGIWTLCPDLGGDWAKVVYGNGMFVAAGEGAVMKSADGKTGWTLRAMEPGYGKDVTYDNGYFFVTGTSGVKRSVDAETWETLTLPVEATWRTIAAGGGGHVVVIGGKCVRSHNGGDSWRERPVPIGGWEESIYVDGFFAAIDGIDAVMVTEADRISWDRREMPNFAFRALAAGNGTIVGVGSRIAVARVIDVGAALSNANGPNGSNPFATMQDVADVKLEAVEEAVAEAKLYWEGVI
jgi:hypothetical protein